MSRGWCQDIHVDLTTTYITQSHTATTSIFVVINPHTVLMSVIPGRYSSRAANMLVVLGPSVLEDGALLRRRRLGLMHCFWCEQQDAVSGDDLWCYDNIIPVAAITKFYFIDIFHYNFLLCMLIFSFYLDSITFLERRFKFYILLLIQSISNLSLTFLAYLFIYRTSLEAK